MFFYEEGSSSRLVRNRVIRVMCAPAAESFTPKTSAAAAEGKNVKGCPKSLPSDCMQSVEHKWERSFTRAKRV